MGQSSRSRDGNVPFFGYGRSLRHDVLFCSLSSFSCWTGRCDL